MNRETPTATALLAAVAILHLPNSAHAADPEGTLARAAAEVASRVESAGPDRGLLALTVSARGASPLATPLETALSAALAGRGFAVAVLRGPQLADAEGAARALGADRLLRVSAGLVPDRRELSLTVEDLPTRLSFFLQRAPTVRPGGGRLFSLAVPADPATLVLAHPAPRPPLGTSAVSVRPIFQVGDRVLALAVGDAAGDGSTAIAVVTPRAISLHGPAGALLARRDLQPGGAVRHLAAAVAMGDFGAGRLAWQLAGGAPGEVLSFRDGALRPVSPLLAAPLAAVAGTRVFGAFLPARATLADRLAPAPGPPVQPRSPLSGPQNEAASPRPIVSTREMVAFAAAPRPGRVAFAALYGDGALQLLGADQKPASLPLTGIGAGFALADLDGDGEPELVASSAEPGPSDRVRVLRLAPGGAEAVFESPPVPGSILAGAAADLTGDGLDDAVLAAVLPSGETQIWLVTADLRLTAAAGGTVR